MKLTLKSLVGNRVSCLAINRGCNYEFQKELQLVASNRGCNRETKTSLSSEMILGRCLELDLEHFRINKTYKLTWFANIKTYGPRGGGRKKKNIYIYIYIFY